MFNNIYRGRRILITGHTGFKGSWLAAWLIMLGADVAGFSGQILTEPSTYLSMGLGNKINDFGGNIRDRAELQKKMAEFEPEIVFHLSAQDSIAQSYLDPVNTFESNMLGTLYVLDAVRQCATVKVIICITSDSCYRDNGWIYAYREDDHLGGNNPYSASQACAEHIAQAYFASFFKNKIACATVRAGNIMGGGDWGMHRLIPDCVRAWAANETLRLDKPNAIYPWIYVLEALSGYLCLAAKLFQAGQEFPELRGQESPDLSVQALSDLSGQAYNFGASGHESYSFAAVIKLLSLHWPDFKSIIIDKENPKPQENAIFKLCIDKAVTKLQWKAVLDLEETVRYTAEWYSAFYSKKNANDKKDMYSYTVGQISAYVNAADNRGILWAR